MIKILIFSILSLNAYADNFASLMGTCKEEFYTIDSAKKDLKNAKLDIKVKKKKLKKLKRSGVLTKDGLTFDKSDAEEIRKLLIEISRKIADRAKARYDVKMHKIVYKKVCPKIFKKLLSNKSKEKSCRDVYKIISKFIKKRNRLVKKRSNAFDDSFKEIEKLQEKVFYSSPNVEVSEERATLKRVLFKDLSKSLKSKIKETIETLKSDNDDPFGKLKLKESIVSDCINYKPE